LKALLPFLVYLSKLVPFRRPMALKSMKPLPHFN
jgi:hypothetical protein